MININVFFSHFFHFLIGQVLNLLWRVLITLVIAILTIVYLIENMITLFAGLNGWHQIKWLTASFTAVFTLIYMIVRIEKVGYGYLSPTRFHCS